jgi:diguanylate cyclase (GGDEF)-like protein
LDAPNLKTTPNKQAQPGLRSAVVASAAVACAILALGVIVYGVATVKFGAARRSYLEQNHTKAVQTVRLVLENACEARLRGVLAASYGIAQQSQQKAKTKEISDEAAKQEATALLQTIRVGGNGRVQGMTPDAFQQEYSRRLLQQAMDARRDETVGPTSGVVYVPEYDRSLESVRGASWALCMMNLPEWNWVIVASIPRDEMGDLVDWTEMAKLPPFAPESDTSFVYILETTKGRVIVHPTWRDETVLKKTDAEKKAFVEEICREKKGTITYTLQNEAGGTSDRIAVYDYLSEQNWIVASEFDLTRLNRSATAAVVGILWTTAGFLILFVPVAFWLAMLHTRRVEAARRESRERTVKELRDEASSLRAHSSRLEKDLANERKIQENLQKTNEQLSAWVDELKQSSHEIALLNQMGDLLQACQTIEETYKVIGKLARDLFPDDAGSLYRFQEEQKMLEMVASWGAEPAAAMATEFALEECWGLRRGKAYVVEDTQTELICQHLTVPPPPHGYICMPMMAQGELLGMFHLKLGQPHPGVPEDARSSRIEAKKRLATTVTEQFGLALANLKLRELLRTQSIRDQLTGLFNRRYMEESLVRELHRAQRQGSSLGIVMADLDHFKRINDTYGHDDGDVILRNVGALFQKSIRQDDIACRYGGEEFIIIMPNASRAIVLQRAEQIRERVKRHVSVKQEPVTISLGVALFPDDGQSSETLLNAADTALYNAKNRGRDQVAVFQAPDA